MFATPHPKTEHHCNVNQQSSQPQVFNRQHTVGWWYCTSSGADPSDVLREAVPCVRRVPSSLVVVLFNQILTEMNATDETCREISCPILFLENGPVTSNEKSHMVVSFSEELYQCGRTDL